jgi:hypothetical protein
MSKRNSYFETEGVIVNVNYYQVKMLMLYSVQTTNLTFGGEN